MSGKKGRNRAQDVSRARKRPCQDGVSEVPARRSWPGGRPTDQTCLPNAPSHPPARALLNSKLPPRTIGSEPAPIARPSGHQSSRA
ncbi:hypothetical protein VTH06DRAFT_4538 [Thermothelomyces fergusii]